MNEELLIHIRGRLDDMVRQQYKSMSDSIDDHYEKKEDGEEGFLEFIESIQDHGKGSMAQEILDVLPEPEPSDLVKNYRAACRLSNNANLNRESYQNSRQVPDETGHKMIRYAYSIREDAEDEIYRRLICTQLESTEDHVYLKVEDPITKLTTRVTRTREEDQQIMPGDRDPHVRRFVEEILHLGVDPI